MRITDLGIAWALTEVHEYIPNSTEKQYQFELRSHAERTPTPSPGHFLELTTSAHNFDFILQFRFHPSIPIYPSIPAKSSSATGFSISSILPSVSVSTRCFGLHARTLGDLNGGTSELEESCTPAKYVSTNERIRPIADTFSGRGTSHLETPHAYQSRHLCPTPKECSTSCVFALPSSFVLPKEI